MGGRQKEGRSDGRVCMYVFMFVDWSGLGFVWMDWMDG